jgi:hypothetical protein
MTKGWMQDTLMTTVAGSIFKDVANVTISAGGWKEQALVEIQQRRQQMLRRGHFGLAVWRGKIQHTQRRGSTQVGLMPSVSMKELNPKHRLHLLLSYFHECLGKARKAI